MKDVKVLRGIDRTIFEVSVGEILPEDVMKYLERIRETFPKNYIKKESK